MTLGLDYYFHHPMMYNPLNMYSPNYPSQEVTVNIFYGVIRILKRLSQIIDFLTNKNGIFTVFAFVYFSSHFLISSGDTLLFDKSMYPAKI